MLAIAAVVAIASPAIAADVTQLFGFTTKDGAPLSQDETNELRIKLAYIQGYCDAIGSAVAVIAADGSGSLKSLDTMLLQKLNETSTSVCINDVLSHSVLINGRDVNVIVGSPTR